MPTTDHQKAALVIGAGDATGGAIARRFAREGYVACVVRRTADKLAPLVAQIEAAGGRARGFGCDARKEDEVIALIETIESEVGPIEVFVFNVGANVPSSILDETARKYFKIWEMACFAGFLTAREAARRMVGRGRGTMIFTGATASLRGKPTTVAFAAAKAGLRSLAQSMARAYGPKGIHVAHVVIDGGIAGDKIIQGVPQFAQAMGEDGLVGLEGLADAYWWLHAQPRNAWTHELDLRTFKEPF